MCMKVWEKLVEKKWELKILLDVPRKEEKKKSRKETHEEKKKKSEKKEKYKAKNVYVVGKIEAQMRMKEKWAKKMIYAHIFEYALLVLQILCETLDLFFMNLFTYSPFERPHDSLIVCDLSSGDRVDKQAYGRRCFHKNLSVNTNL